MTSKSVPLGGLVRAAGERAAQRLNQELGFLQGVIVGRVDAGALAAALAETAALVADAPYRERWVECGMTPSGIEFVARNAHQVEQRTLTWYVSGPVADVPPALICSALDVPLLGRMARALWHATGDVELVVSPPGEGTLARLFAVGESTARGFSHPMTTMRGMVIGPPLCRWPDSFEGLASFTVRQGATTGRVLRLLRTAGARSVRITLSPSELGVSDGAETQVLPGIGVGAVGMATSVAADALIRVLRQSTGEVILDIGSADPQLPRAWRSELDQTPVEDTWSADGWLRLRSQTSTLVRTSLLRHHTATAS